MRDESHGMHLRAIVSDAFGDQGIISTDVFATLYAKQEMFSVKPEVGTPIRGVLWMTGKIR